MVINSSELVYTADKVSRLEYQDESTDWSLDKNQISSQRACSSRREEDRFEGRVMRERACSNTSERKKAILNRAY